MTKLEIIEETVEYYKNNPRAINAAGQCVYLNLYGTPGCKCAVGRCMRDEILSNPPLMTILNSCGSVGNILYSKNIDIPKGEGFDYFLKPQYKGHDIDFWDDVQVIHDYSENWSVRWAKGKYEYNLTQKGDLYVAQLKARHARNDTTS